MGLTALMRQQSDVGDSILLPSKLNFLQSTPWGSKLQLEGDFTTNIQISFLDEVSPQPTQ